MPLGLFIGKLHLTWGNLSFNPQAKVKVLLHGVTLLAALLVVLRILVRPDPRRPYRWGSSAALSVAAVLIVLTAVRATTEFAVWLPQVAIELGVLAVAAGTLYRITGSPAGPAAAVTVVWMTRTAGMVFAEGAFEGIGMVVTTPAYERFCVLLWPLAWTLFLTWHTPRLPAR